MHPGLAIVVVPAGAYTSARVGFFRHVSGVWWELVGARVLLRKSWSGERKGFAWLAANGLTDQYMLMEASEEPEPVLDLNVVRVIYCNREAWAQKKNGAFQPPKGWVEHAA